MSANTAYLGIIFLFTNLLWSYGILGMQHGPESAISQTNSTQGLSHIIYISPVPGSTYLTPGTNIIIRSDEDIDAASLGDEELFAVVGSISGNHTGNVVLADDRCTILFNPNTPFTSGEKVSVSMVHPLVSIKGDSISLSPFSFTISSTNLNADKALIARMASTHLESPLTHLSPRGRENGGMFGSAQLENELAGLPPDFPPLMVTTSDSPTPGYIFLATNMNEGFYNSYGNYLIIVDNAGYPVFYRKVDDERNWDFKLQPTGVLTFYHTTIYPDGKHYIMNTSFQVIDSITARNGYLTNGHELRILPNGNIFLLASDYETIDMSKIVPGGNPNAIVSGIVIQELDKNKNLIFQWRTFDHFNITDAIGQNLDSSYIDAVHSNAIEVDTDGNILLSSRYLCEITKINVQTGEIIWRLGGKNNQFKFLNDTLEFTYQHFIRRLVNGDISLFDNGNLHDPQFSRVLEYKLDEINKTATLVWSYTPSPTVYAGSMGDAQRLANGNTMVGWGSAHFPTLREVRPNGGIALEMSYPVDSVWSYRVYRFPFLFIKSPTHNDTIHTGNTTTLRWISSGLDTIRVDYSADYGNSWSRLATSYMADADSITFSVPTDSIKILQFRITDLDTVNGKLSFLSDEVSVVGGVNGVVPTSVPYSYALFGNYPNPFNPSTTIKYEVASMVHVTLKLYNVLGEQVATLVDAVKGPGEYSVKFDGSRFASGVYFYRLSTSSGFLQVKKMVLEK